MTWHICVFFAWQMLPCSVVLRQSPCAMLPTISFARGHVKRVLITRCLCCFWYKKHSVSRGLLAWKISAKGEIALCEVKTRSQVWVGTQFPLRLDYGRSPHTYVNQRLQIQLELLMMSDIPLETCWAFNERWNNKFRYRVASCWLFLLR